MDSWNEKYPFSQEELSLFTRLHQQATRFPVPATIKTRPAVSTAGKEREMEHKESTPSLGHAAEVEQLKESLDAAQLALQCKSDLLRSLDLLLEAQQQLLLRQDASASNTVTAPAVSTSTTAAAELEAVRNELCSRAELQDAKKLIVTTSIPALTTSPAFQAAFAIIAGTDDQTTGPATAHAASLMQRCWDNALLAMRHVLYNDLTSIEVYLDDPAYTQMLKQLCLPLLALTSANARQVHRLQELQEHFAQSYLEMRCEFVQTVIDGRLNAQDSLLTQSPQRIHHLLERTRLMMTVEQEHFDRLFPAHDSRRLLEAVGNCMLRRIGPVCESLTPIERAPLLSLLQNLAETSNYPFVHFVKLLLDLYFPGAISTAAAVTSTATSTTSTAAATTITTADASSSKMPSTGHSNILEV